MRSPEIGESPLQAMKTAATLQRANLEQGADVRAPKALSGFRKWLGTSIVLGAGALVNIGCDTQAEEAPKPEKPQPRQVEQAEGVSNKALLQDAFNRVCGNARAKMPDGSLVVHIGGGAWYSLTNEDLAELMNVIGSMPPPRANNPQVQEAFKRTNAMKVKSSIMRVGTAVPVDQLPKEMQEFENARQEMLRNMQQ